MAQADVLVVAHQHLPSDPRVSRQLDALADAGIGGDVVCLRGRGQPRDGEYRGFRLHRLPVDHQRSPGLVPYVVEYVSFFALALVAVTRLYLRRRHPVVITHTLPDPLVFTALVPKLCGAKLIMDAHEYTPELFRTRFGVGPRHPMIRFMALLEQMSCAFADRVVTVHDPGVEILVGRGTPRRKIDVVMNTARMEPARALPERDPGRPFTLVYHGTLVNQYDLDTALDALALLTARGADVRLRIVGGGPMRDELARRAQLPELAGRVSMESPVALADIPALLRQCDAGIVPMRDIAYAYVTLPMKIMECVAEGLPVITNATPVLRHYFDEQAMVYVPFEDAVALADAIETLAGDAALRREMAARAHAAIWPRRLEEEGRRMAAIAMQAAARA